MGVFGGLKNFNICFNILKKDVVNDEIARTWNKKYKSYKRNCNKKELVQFYSIWMQIENSYGNNTTDLRKHFQKIKTEIGVEMPFGQKRFLLLRKCMNPKLDQLNKICNILTKNFQKFVLALFSRH